MMASSEAWKSFLYEKNGILKVDGNEKWGGSER